MALPNAEKLTSQMAMLPDAALKQMAMMHKSDPYVLPLIISEDGRRKQMRQAAQAQMASQPQPKVADAALAQMGQLPEEQGIAQLPSPNIQHMADGGIAGFDESSNAPITKHNTEKMGDASGAFNYAQSDGGVVLMAGGGMPKYSGKGEQLVRTTDGGKSWFLDVPAASRGNPSPAAALANQKFSSKQEAIAAFDSLTGGGTAIPESVGAGMGMPTGVGLPAGADVSKLQQPTYVPSSAAPGAPTSGNQPPAPPAVQQGLGSLPSTKVLTPEQAKEQAGEFADFGEARTALKKAESDQESQGARLRTMLADGLPKTPAMEGLEKLLDKQDAETGGEKDKAAGLALLSAGLAIAGGSSRFALQNLKEAIPAVTQYGDALKDIKKMERENMKMRGEIEQARRAESRDDTKLKLQLEEKIGDRQDKINELGIGLTSKIAGTTAEVASKLWSTSFDAANREKVAGIQAGAQANAQLNLYKQLGAAPEGSPLLKGFERYKQEGAEPRMYSEYVKLASDPMKGEDFLKKYPNFDVYKAGMGGGQGQIYTDNNVNPNAVRTR
jgi:hypothetical protein